MSTRSRITPHGRLLLELAAEDSAAASESALTPDVVARWQAAFEESSASGLLALADPGIKAALPSDLVYWREFAQQVLQAVAALDEEQLAAAAKSGLADVVKTPDELKRAVLVADAPPMIGLEYLTSELLATLWGEVVELIGARAAETDGGVAAFLRVMNPALHLLGRVTFHLAENKKDPARPFAFLATYSHKLSAKAQVQHLPLGQALKQYAGERDQAKLAELLTPVREASNVSTVTRELLSSRGLFQPQAWSIEQAYAFLRDVPLMEQSGLVVRVPNWWRPRNPTRPQVRVSVGKKASVLGLDAMLDFSVDLAIDGEPLTDAERKQLLKAADGLVLLKGKWVEVDQEKLQAALAQWNDLQAQHANGIDFLSGMRLLAGTPLDKDEVKITETADWSHITAGDWLREMLEQIRDPSGIKGCEPGVGLQATLRPYQADGVRWMWFMLKLGLGACLADDMGLGKTIQVIDLLLRLRGREVSAQGNGTKRTTGTNGNAALLVVPASLIGNWKQELTKFAPQLNVVLAHRSECDAATLDRLAKNPQQELAGADVVITTYTLVRKAEWLSKVKWQLVVLDEAQAIKSAGSAQTKAVKKLTASGRIALTGTPVENQLGDLWSLFDFCCPGLLGSASEFSGFVKKLDKQQSSRAYGSLRRLVKPYILRRMKTDPNIVPDLPEKTEMRAECGLSKQQAVLYQKEVEDLEKKLEEADGIRRRGLVLATLMRLKQICNHPSQFLEQPTFEPDASSKFVRLGELCEPIIERQEKVLVFTQFQSMCEPLAKYLATVFSRSGLVLHGGVAVGKRKELVKQFQEDERIPFFVISVKAGGTGLNLTAASHVVHFDRWWNPAVENQATDRAFRIGQKRNVLVHKFVCRGTLEERIDQMIEDKKALSNEVLNDGGEVLLSEMSNSELLQFVALDIHRAGE